MHKNGKTERTTLVRSAAWVTAAIALLLFPLFMMSSLAQAATDVSKDAFPIRQCFVKNRVNKITNNEMVSRFDGINQSGNPEPVYFTGSGMKWVEYSDGSARLMGDMLAIGDPMNSGLTVDVTFSNKAIANGNLEYDSFFGTMTGSGGYDGAVVSVQPAVKSPSFRFWNNGPDAEGWIQWVVNTQSSGGQLLTEAGQSGVWSFSINPNCKTMPAPTYTPVPKVPGMIGNQVFKDNNQNGIQDAEDEGVAGIEVLLWTDDDEDGTPDTVIATQTTDANGMYQFQGLSPHVTYFVQFIIPADAEKLFTTQNAGGNEAADSDPDPATGITGPINVVEGEKNDTVDAGVINSPASLGDRVWRDTNRNGVQDAGEPGEDGVTVYLLDGDKNILDSTITANGGMYSFSNLNPKEVYRVRFEAPANTGFTSQDAGGNDGADSDAAPDTGQTDPISLAPGENNDDIDAGIVNDFVTLGDTVFKDDDKDGVQDAGEPGIAGVTVNLLTKDKGMLLSTTTDANGKYTFSVDPKNSYIIEVVVPADKDVAPKDASPDDTADSDIGDDGRTEIIQPTPGENDSTIDAGLSNKGASVGDTVFSDLDRDGVQDAGEPGVGGVTVNLLSKDGTVLASTTTDAGGNYGFGDLDPKQGYLIQVVIPDGKDASPQDAGGDDAADSDIGPDGTTANISLTPGEEDPTVDAGLVNEDAILGDTVFSDLDGDGIQDPGEPGVAGVTVNLLDKGKTVLQTTTTDSAGNYSFTVDPKQSYIIEFVAPAEFVFTDPNEGADDATDSDADPDTGRTDPIQPTAGDTDDTIDAGLIGRKSTIGDLVFKDDNGNGQQDAGEPGIEDVTVNLLDKAGNVVDTTTTDANGNYGFSVDSTDSYVVQVVVPAGKGITTPDTGDDATDSDIGPDGKTDFIEIGPSQSDDTIDAGLVNLPGSINGVVWNDANENGVRDAGEAPVAGATVQLITPDKSTVLDSTTTGADGSYTFSGLNPKESYRVRFTAPADTIITTQDAGGDDTVDSDAAPDTGQTDEITVPADGSTDNVDAGVVDQPGSITGTLFKDDDGDGVQDADEPGIPGQKVSLQDKAGNPIASATTDGNGDYAFPDLDPGSDYVVVFDSVPDTVFTTQDSGDDDDVDSDVDPTTGATGSITVPANDTADNVDAGVVWIPGTVTGTVFDDINRDGIQDAGEPVREGVTVNLLDKDGNVLATTTTNGNGDYSFSGLDPKAPGYIVEVEEPAGKEFTGQNVGGDDTVDSDVDPTTGQSDNIQVPANGTVEDVDAGLVNILGGITGVVFNDLNDNGVQDAGEPVVSGVTVELISKDGATVYDTTTTDNSGAYSFTGVDPKISYRVRFTAPANQGLTDQDVGDDDTIDSDPDPTTGETDFIDVPAGETVDNVDAGVVDQPGGITGTLFKDDDGDGVQDPSEPGIPGATVVLQDKDGNVVAETTTDANGNYSFPDLDPNQSYVVKFTAPADSVLSPQDAGTDDTVDSDANPDTGLTGFIDVPANGTTENVDAGVVWIPGTLTGVVFKDDDNDGQRDADEPLVEGVVVTLLDKGGNVLGTDTTDENGAYGFSNLDPKISYVVKFDEPAAKEFTTQDTGDDATDSDVDPATGESGDVNVPANGTASVDAGVRNLPGGVTGVVFTDLNRNDIQDADEPGVAGVTVELISEDKATVYATTTTAADGSYSLPVDDPKLVYRVRFTEPATQPFVAQNVGGDDAVDSDPDPATGQTDPFEVPADGTVPDVDAGVEPETGKVGGVVFKDDDFDGMLDAGEELEGITVNLLTKDGTVVATTTTSADGTYSFPGTDSTVSYIVEVERPDDKLFTDPAGDSDIDPTTGQSDPVNVAPDGTTPVNAGLQNAPGSITGMVFNDANDNGIMDAGEGPVSGVTVQLISEDKSTVIATVTTDDDGNYTLPVADPKDTYRVRFTEPANQDFVEQDAGDDDTVDSDADPTTGQTDPINVPADGTVPNVDAGVRPSDGKAGGVVFKDDDKDGVQDADEPTIGGITVNLLAKDGTLIDSTETAADGTYSFPGVDSTVSYVVEFELPGDKLFTSPGADSDVDPTTGQSPSVVVPADGIVDVSAGMVNKSGTLGDTVFKDDNENGIQDAGEGGVEGVTVRLLDKDDNVIATATTDVNGQYTFSVDPKQGYVIEVVEPAGYDFSPQDAPGSTDLNDSDVDPATGQTDNITVAADGTDDSIDAGLVWEPGTIAGTAWKDDNKDGIRDANEPLLEGITVKLWIAGTSGNMFASTETDSSGNYVFTDVNPKLTYNVQFDVPGDKEVTQSNAGSDDTVDSDITAEGMTKEPISVSANEDVTNIDAGFFNKSASVSGLVWNDLDRDGIQDAGEPGEPGATVELLAKDGSVVATTTTDSDGNYLFTDVDPKQGYLVRFTAPGGTGFTTPDAGGDDTVDSDAGTDGTSENITVEPDQETPVDAGIVTTLGSISGTITKDDEPGGAVGLAGVTVQLQDKAGNELDATVTGADGTYSFDGLEPGDQYVVVVLAPADKNFVGDGTSGSITVAPGDKTTFNEGLTNKPATIGDKVFKDDNQNGIQDAGEPGIAGITVNLMDAGKTVLDTTTTDADGMYSFTVDPKGGQYIIQFELPADKEFTTPDAGSNDAEDSDVTDPTSGQTDPVTVGADETNPTVDAGMVNKGASVGNLVFRDLDNDGIQDAGEPGIAGVTVNLRLKDGTLVETATTGADGTYDFIEVDPKEGYEVEFVAPDAINGIDETFTTPDVGTDDTIDSDAGPDGSTDGSIDVAAGEDNPTVDAGLTTTFDLALRKTIGEAEKLVLDGDTVIFDIEVCNQGNVPASDILIVDYIPGAFSLNDAAWTQVGNQAEYTIAGPLAPGACTTVEIGLKAAFSPGVLDGGAIRAASVASPDAIETFEFVSNKAEIVQASDSAGNVRTSDVDSTYDRDEMNDPVIDDEINLTPAGGDEDDHDKAIVQVLPRDLGTSGDVNADGARTAVDALFILRNDVAISALPISEPGRSGAGSQEEIDDWCGTIGAFSHNGSTVSGDFNGDGSCDGADYGDYVCDVSGDNQCNSIDALFILQCDVGLSNAFCAQP